MRNYFLPIPMTIALCCHTLLVGGTQISLEIQSNCLEMEELDRVLGGYIFPGLQDSAAPSDSISFSSVRGQGFLNRKSAEKPLFTGYSISNGSGRRLEEEDEGEEEEISPRAIPNIMDCPVAKKCPCNGCPGHWCLIFCGYQQNNRRLEEISKKNFVRRVSDEPSAQKGASEVYQSTDPEQVVANEQSLKSEDQEALICSALERLLSAGTVSETCLSDAIILSCSLSP
jgi:hypothetical protein